MKQQLQKIKSWIPILYYALKDQETPFYAKAMALLTLGYILSPIDLIPDFIPILGYLDDVIIVSFCILVTKWCIPKSVWIRCQKRVKKHAISLKKKWFYAIPIVLIQGILFVYLLYLLF